MAPPRTKGKRGSFKVFEADMERPDIPGHRAKISTTVAGEVVVGVWISMPDPIVPITCFGDSVSLSMIWNMGNIASVMSSYVK